MLKSVTLGGHYQGDECEQLGGELVAGRLVQRSGKHRQIRQVRGDRRLREDYRQGDQGAADCQ